MLPALANLQDTSPSVPSVTILQRSPLDRYASSSRPVAHFAGTRKLAFAIRTSKIQGKGAFATRNIRKGARIIEYLGECIDEDEADIRYPDDEMGRHHTFLFAIGDGTRVLDAGPLDWPAKYINHACDPNCEAIEEEDGRVFIGALKNIAVGAELLYDYAYERTPEHTQADEKMYTCRCGSPKCRGTIMAPPKVKKSKRKGKKGEKKQKKSQGGTSLGAEESKDRKANRKEQQQQSKEEQRKQAADAAPDLPAAHAAKHAATKRGTTAGAKVVLKRGSKSAGTRGTGKGGSKVGTRTGTKAVKQRTKAAR